MTYEEVRAMEAQDWITLLQDSEWVRLFEKRAVLRRKMECYAILGRKAELHAASKENWALSREANIVANQILSRRAAS